MHEVTITMQPLMSLIRKSVSISCVRSSFLSGGERQITGLRKTTTGVKMWSISCSTQAQLISVQRCPL